VFQPPLSRLVQYFVKHQLVDWIVLGVEPVDLGNLLVVDQPSMLLESDRVFHLLLVVSPLVVTVHTPLKNRICDEVQIMRQALTNPP
jgi:hypothetical protein